MNIIQMGFRLMVDQALYPTGSGPDMLFISPFVGNCQAAVCCQGPEVLWQIVRVWWTETPAHKITYKLTVKGLWWKDSPSNGGHFTYFYQSRNDASSLLVISYSNRYHSRSLVTLVLWSTSVDEKIPPTAPTPPEDHRSPDAHWKPCKPKVGGCRCGTMVFRGKRWGLKRWNVCPKNPLVMTNSLPWKDPPFFNR